MRRPAGWRRRWVPAAGGIGRGAASAGGRRTGVLGGSRGGCCCCCLTSEVIPILLIELIGQGFLLGQHVLDPGALVVHDIELVLLLADRLGVLLSGPLGALAGAGSCRGEVGVVLGDRAHVLEPVGELREVLGAQQDVDLGAGTR